MSKYNFIGLRFGFALSLVGPPNQKFLLLRLIAPVTVPILRDTNAREKDEFGIVIHEEEEGAVLWLRRISRLLSPFSVSFSLLFLAPFVRLAFPAWFHLAN